MLNLKYPLVSSITLLIILGLGILSFNLQSFWHQDKYSVIIAVSKTPLSTPFYIAKAINAFDDTCVRVKYEQVIGGKSAFDKVMSGEVDFGTSSDSVIAFQSLTTPSFVSHAMFVQSDNDVKLITHSADNIKSALDLKGKKVAVTQGTASEYLLSTLLAIEGLTMADVKLYYDKPPQLLQAFSRDEVDAIVSWEPFVFQLLQALDKKIKIHDTKSLSTLSFNLISQTADSQGVEKAKCVIQGLQTAIHYIASHPQAAKKIVIDELNLDPAFIDWVWPDYIFKLGLNQSLILNIRSQALWVVETQMRVSNSAPNSLRFVDSRALLQVDPGAVDIPLQIFPGK
ncbi:NrtA/SsuA/CpmA family ABC transporter substrate-binding protein [Colwellia sp. MB02u-9]|uniref:ABC transporter substrate-binding protein n=1 Tax=Colwellia sp. MB02u-9 TaxID=2759823 RepID=UPI00286FBE59|nr:NrtA/SsuA/CpmA family ABC transporter substrate-binding protein [Colwellia sp. MB02u-9]